MFTDVLPFDLSPLEFKEHLTDLALRTLQNNGELYVLIGGEREIPLGLVNLTFQGHHVHPHAVWLPEATPRNRLECAAKFLHELRKKHLILIPVEAEKLTLFEHLCEFGVLRKVGTIKGYFKQGNAMLFQSRK